MGNLCPNCFREKSSYGPCSFCGYNPAGEEEKYPLALRPGSILNGRYTVGRVLGQGGFGITYIAQDYQSKERVAIKEYLPAEFAIREAGGRSLKVYSDSRRENFDYGKAQFLEEAKTLAAFNGDRHIVRIYSYFEENNTAYFVMEYVDGYALDKYMTQHGGRLSVPEANRLLMPLMQSLGAVHAKGIIHRDIAPDNILITKDSVAKLIDFGAARYSTGEKSKSLDVILKHGFAPTEQYMRRGRQGPFTDVYAMAATYYYAITGKIPPDAVERMQEDNILLPRSLGIRISGEGEDVLLKALEVNAHDRYRNMAEFYEAMAEVYRPADQAPVSHGRPVMPTTQNTTPASTGGFAFPQTGLSALDEAALLEQRAREIRAEAERREREERERLARIESEKRELERREREAREEAERLERERREREAREEAERKRREAREAAERKRQEAKAEAERLKKERAEQKAREEAARQEKLRLEQEKRKEEKRLAAEKKRKEAEEKERLRQEALSKQKAEQEQKRQEAEQKKAAKAEAERLKKEQAAAKKQTKTAEDTTAPIEGKAKKPSGKKPLIAVIAAVLVVAAGAGYFLSPGQTARRNYSKAVQLMENGQYAEATAQFETITDTNLQSQIPALWYNEGLSRQSSEDWENAAAAFEMAGDYEDAEQRIPAARYSQGIALKNAGDLENAATAFSLVGEYKDAQEQLHDIQQELNYRSAFEHLNSAQYRDAFAAFEALAASDYKDSKDQLQAIRVNPDYQKEIWTDPKVGDTLFFGTYEQDNNLENGKEDIEWCVLAREDDRVLVISQYCLDSQPYNKGRKVCTWENCSLRSWLNQSFFSEAFSFEEQLKIATSTVKADRNPAYDSDQGNDTEDKVFLLSIKEALSYFNSDSERQCQPTAYAEAMGCRPKSIANGSCSWWLRTLGEYLPEHTGRLGYHYFDQLAASVTNHYGKIAMEGKGITYRDSVAAVRPAMWIDLKVARAAASYHEGLALKEAENWNAALQAFEQAGNYLDAKDLAYEVSYQIEIQRIEDAQVGDAVYYGAYEQDNNLENGTEPIEWMVMDVKDGKTLLLSKYALDSQPYNNKSDQGWKNCTLRSWLNSDFLNKAFSTQEQKRISSTTTIYPDSSRNGKNNMTEDKVFLLDDIYVKKYFNSEDARSCMPTAYSAAENAADVNEKCTWWLLCSSTSQWTTKPIAVKPSGIFGDRYNIILSDNNAVRPAIWVDWSED